MEILVVEDSKSETDLIQTCLEEQITDQDEIHFVDNGEDAIRYIFENHSRIKIVLLDLNLPKIKGEDVLKAVKENETTASLPVVVFTTSNNPDDIKKTYSLGTNSYVTKPMGVKKFKSTIASIYDFWVKHNKNSNEQ